MNRRAFLKLTGAAAASAFLGKFPTLAAAGGKTGRRVDFHAHAMLPSYVEGLKRLGIDVAAEEGFPIPQWSEEAHLQFMADAGLDYAVLSMPTPHTYHGDAGLAREVTRAVNEEYAAFCRKHPEKFGFVAALPLPDVEGALEEIRYAAKRLGARTVFMLHNLSYTRRESFRYFDEIVVPSAFAGRCYYERLGIETQTLAPLIDPQKTLVRENTRRFVTFVNPSPEKGLYFFVGLARIFNERRPDVLFQLVEGRGRLERLATIPEARRLTNLYALRRVSAPSDFLKETRLLLVPSLCEETFGRVVVEAGLNGIPALCGNRGSLPELVDDSELLLPIPSRFTPTSRILPTEEELEPWFSAVSRLWDDSSSAASAGQRLQKRFQRYSYPVVAAQTEELFRSFAEKSDDARRLS